jgi:protein SCO1/2
MARLLRRASVATIGLILLATQLAGCHRSIEWRNTDITGSLPPLNFTMTRARDGKVVTGGDYRGRVAFLYFGYTYCPDACPTTLSNLATILRHLGRSAADVRVLFVTVDPDRDSLPVLKRYAAAFAPQVDALRGDPDELASLGRRYRVAYSVDPKDANGAYVVNHSSAVYVFDRLGKPRLLATSLSGDKPDIDGTVDDLRALLN